ncbi:MAG: PIN domain-containing protein [Paludibacteraceae bacterium]|jgi:predicted nucleic acid-binding protein|nr:PIN domain-containing protein [Paludibacteraceae bacterium]MDO4524103.1 PIN domain-containing protein [Bacteroidales bacterium]MEE1177039.1 PIN domain-containing protein [Paludibacteraceae bacterium]MEE1260083.1 PIN domain-containing protein [Paludibacteraceae bacterium]
MKVFLDANVLIDVVQNRIDFVETSSKVLQLGLDGECELCASDITFTTVSFYARKNRTQEQLYEVLQSLRDFIDVAPSGKIAIDWALQQKSKDFEDSVQYYTALRSGAEYIVSRNVRDYPYNDIPVVSPIEFLKKMGVE